MPYYAIINSKNNTVENVGCDERPAKDITVPAPYFLIDIEDKVCICWKWDSDTNEYRSSEGVGNAGIGCIWDGTKFETAKPPPPLPSTSSAIPVVDVTPNGG